VVNRYCGDPVVQISEGGRRFVDRQNGDKVIRVGYVWDIGNAAAYDKHEWRDVTGEWNGFKQGVKG
jgi:hypothetical protein